MNIEEFENARAKIDAELQALIVSNNFIVGLHEIYIKKYLEILDKVIIAGNADIVRHLGYKLYQVVVFSEGMKKLHQGLNETAIPAFNQQFINNTSLNDQLLKLIASLNKIKKDRQKGAKALHAETEQMKLEILNHYATHHDDFQSKDEAAMFYTTQYPLKFSTIRNYLKSKKNL